jgi:hypothetical protein
MLRIKLYLQPGQWYLKGIPEICPTKLDSTQFGFCTSRYEIISEKETLY